MTAQLAELEAIIVRERNSHDPSARPRLGEALVEKGEALLALDRLQVALECFEEVVRAYGDSPAPALREPACRALYGLGYALARLERQEPALEAFAELRRLVAGGDARALGWLRARGDYHEALLLQQLGRREEALLVLGDLLNSYDADRPPRADEDLAAAMHLVAVLAGELGQPDPALAMYDKLMDRYGGAAAGPIRLTVVEALLSKAATLAQLGRAAEAVEASTEAVGRASDAGRTPLARRVLVRAMWNRVVWLDRAGRQADAAAARRALHDRFAGDSDPGIQAELETAWAVVGDPGA